MEKWISGKIIRHGVISIHNTCKFGILKCISKIFKVDLKNTEIKKIYSGKSVATHFRRHTYKVYYDGCYTI